MSIPKKIEAIIVGFCIAFGVAYAFSILFEFTEHIKAPDTFLTVVLLYNCLPALFGCIYTGYKVQRRGWLYGLLCGVLFWIVWFMVGIGAIIWWKAVSQLKWDAAWFGKWMAQLVGMLVFGFIGGYLGQLVAQKRLKKKAEEEC